MSPERTASDGLQVFAAAAGFQVAEDGYFALAEARARLVHLRHNMQARGIEAIDSDLEKVTAALGRGMSALAFALRTLDAEVVE